MNEISKHNEIELSKMSNEEIKKLIVEGKVDRAKLTDSGICPTCFDRNNGKVLFGENEDKTIYEDKDFECILDSNPRAVGHTLIFPKKHYKDMMEIDDELCTKIFLLAKKIMNLIKEIYNAESVYMCTMCDGKMNHFHIQLIPRYSYEDRGSKNFVKPRLKYSEEPEKIKKLRKELHYKENE